MTFFDFQLAEINHVIVVSLPDDLEDSERHVESRTMKTSDEIWTESRGSDALEWAGAPSVAPSESPLFHRAAPL